VQINKTESIETITCPFCLIATTESYAVQGSKEQFCKSCAVALSWGMAEELSGQIECEIVQQDDMTHRLRVTAATEDARERLNQLMIQHGLTDVE